LLLYTEADRPCPVAPLLVLRPVGPLLAGAPGSAARAGERSATARTRRVAGRAVVQTEGLP